MKLVSAVGFSNGWAELALKKPPPLVPSILIDFLRGDRAEQRCSAWRLPAWWRPHTRPGSAACPARYKKMADHDRERQQHVQRDAREIDPEIADRFRGAAGEAADERDGDGDTRSRRQEVLHGEADHLDEIAHGRLAAIALPVGVGQEADGGVVGQIGRHRALTGRVERQHRLEAQQCVQEQEADQLEHQHGDGIADPALLGFRVHAGCGIKAALHRAQHRREEIAFAGE